MNLADTLQHWLQGQINASIDGVLARLGALEWARELASKDLNDLNAQLGQVTASFADRIGHLESNNDALERRLTELEIENSNLVNTNLGLEYRVRELEDRAVEVAPDEQLEGFADRVRCIVADYIDNDDQLMTRHMFDEALDAFFNESSFKIKVR